MTESISKISEFLESKSEMGVSSSNDSEKMTVIIRDVVTSSNIKADSSQVKSKEVVKKKPVTDQEPIILPIKNSKTNIKPSSINNSCTDDTSLNTAITVTGKMFSISQRDKSYKKLINKALCRPNFELAITTTKKLFSISERDSIYINIVKVALEEKEYNIASKVTEKIFSISEKDKMKMLLIDAISS